MNLRYGPGPGRLTTDPEGDELADATRLRPHALRIAREMMKTRAHAVRDWMTCSFEITDEAHRLVIIVPFSDTVGDAEGGASVGS